MKRTKKPTVDNPSAILVGDIHLREDQPLCRTDNFWEAQWHKLTWLQTLQQKYGCPVYCAGDVFHNWKASPYLISLALNLLPNDFWTVYGNHDLPRHNFDLRDRSALRTCELAAEAKAFDEVHWGQEPNKGTLHYPGPERTLLVWHVMTYKEQEPWPGCTDLSAKQILEKYPQFDLILTGHNHQCFVEELEGRKLVNPGSFTRQTADQIDHQPCVFLWDQFTNDLTKMPVPCAPDVISRQHLEQSQERKERYEAFIARLNQEGDPELSFEKNLEKYFRQNSVVKSVRDLIYRELEG